MMHFLRVLAVGIVLVIIAPGESQSSMVEKALEVYQQARLAVSTDRLRSHIQTAFSRPRSYRHVDETNRVRAYIRGFFQNLTKSCNSAKVEEQLLDCQHTRDGTGLSNDTWIPGICANIFMVQRGIYWGTSRDQVMLVGAHYDSQLNTPGVNDNGAGMAAMLETARVVTQDQCRRDHTIIYVAFDKEEFGYTGGEIFVNNYLVPEVVHQYSVKFDGAIILDTVFNFNNQNHSQIAPPGAEEVFPELYKLLQENQFRGNFLAFIGRQSDDELMRNMSAAWSSIQGYDQFLHFPLELPFSGRVLNGFYQHVGHFLRSDHAAFWEAKNTLYGLSAIQLADTANFRKPMDACYHHPCDNLSNMLTDENLQFLTKTTQAIVYTVSKNVVISSASTQYVAPLATLMIMSILHVITKFS